jgi:hypothetical protein
MVILNTIGYIFWSVFREPYIAICSLLLLSVILLAIYTLLIKR